MNKFDKFAYSGFLASFGIYYTNLVTDILSNLNLSPEVYNLTVGGLPEYFTGVLGVRLANKVTEKAFKILNKEKIKKIRKEELPDLINKTIEKFDKNKTLISTFGASSLIMGFGIVDETLYNLSGGTQDLNDILMYGLGIGTSIIYNYLHKNSN